MLVYVPVILLGQQITNGDAISSAPSTRVDETQKAGSADEQGRAYS